MEVRLFTFFSRLAQAENWTKTKDFHLSCNLTFLVILVNPSQLGPTADGQAVNSEILDDGKQ